MEALDTVDAGTEPERNTLLVAYILHALGAFTGGVTAIAGVIVNHIKVNETDSIFIRSHHRWLLRTFWFGVLWMIIATVLAFIGIGFLIYLAVGIWYIYRIVRGFISYSERKALPMA
ncbi:hypothetical protein JN531_002645 [Flagellatimonas centrodinii]|uniref:DUF4870 family protein n=1 Tax=Flagellatimonas centrodinii TaxID=2806210 RepID=UPI001FEE1FF3|nr:hypothetical protein [Flagellatimonas centrodinii]ULQ47190.1 hypothetical protein JN531_002645 [Flagellatimonas centrodinii]